jgi:pimeloyl-ACP methyl ester carboxylesterase
MADRDSEEATPGSTGWVTSADGTIIGYRQLGRGPGVIILHGGLRASHHYMRLAQALADTYTVYLPDRRGRGLSHTTVEAYSITKECEDLCALLQTTSARMVFGHSAGGLIALEAALTLPIHKLAVYEPAVSIDGSFPIDWVPAFDQALARNKPIKAMVAFLKGVRLNWVSTLPQWTLYPLAYLMLSGADGCEMGEVLPTITREVQEVQRLDSTHERYRTIAAETLLLCGTNGPLFLRDALHRLAAALPNTRIVELPKLDHNAPDLNAPDVIANQLRRFLA